MIGIGLGMFLNELVEKELIPLNEERVAAGLKPFTAKEYFDASKGLTNIKPDEYSKAVINKLTANTKAEVAALKVIPKGTFTDIVDDVAKKIGAPAAAVGTALEKLRNRKNVNAATEQAASEAKAAASAAKTANYVAGVAPSVVSNLNKSNLAKASAAAANLGEKAIKVGPWGSALAVFDSLGDAQERLAPSMTVNPEDLIPYQAGSFGYGAMPYMIYPTEQSVREGKARVAALKDLQMYKDIGWNIGNMATLGTLSEAERLNQISAQDGELTIGEQIGNVFKAPLTNVHNALTDFSKNIYSIGDAGITYAADKVKSNEQKTIEAANRADKNNYNK